MIVGFIGLGRMGAGMAARLDEARHSLLVHDLAPGAAQALVARGAQAASSAHEVGAGADIVFASLPSPAIVEAAIGEAAGGGRARIIVDLSTSVSADRDPPCRKPGRKGHRFVRRASVRRGQERARGNLVVDGVGAP